MPETAIRACPTCHCADGVCGVQVRGVFDGVLYWECMDDGTIWHRWPEGHRLHQKAVEAINSRRKRKG